MSSLTQFFGGSIKSIQRGTISLNGVTSATATITAVNTAKTELRFLGAQSGATFGGATMKRIELTNSTTVTANCQTNGATPDIVSWELTEWN